MRQRREVVGDDRAGGHDDSRNDGD